MGWQDDAIAGAPAAPAPKAWETDAPVGPTPQQKAVTSANDNGEEAAKALQISKRTGIPAPTVQSDLPGYGEHDRRQSAIKAVQNPFIAKYIDGNPMAAKVSGDDYDKLDEVSQTLQALHPNTIKDTAHRQVVNSIPELAQALSTGPGRAKLAEAALNLPSTLLEDVTETTRSGVHGAIESLGAPGARAKGPRESFWSGFLNQFKDVGSVGVGAFGLATSPFLPIMGVTKTLIARPLAIAEGAPLPEVEAEVGKAMLALKPGKGGAGAKPIGSVDDFLAEIRGKQTRAEIDEFLRKKAEGESGPPGAQLAIEHAKAGSEALDKAMETAQTSKTRERSPELFAEAAEAHDPGNVHVDGAKLMELYQKEGKVPAPGDGLLGDVPGIAGKIAAAEATGGEVTIPVSQYIAHVDPTVHEGLKDSVRLHDDGVTLEEAKEHEKAIEAWHGTPHDFEQFDLTKIGTGEGAQFYGHGLYFAENKSVAAEYQKELSRDFDTVKINGEHYDENNMMHRAAIAVSELGDRANAIYETETSVLRLTNETKDYPEYKELAKKEAEVLKILKSNTPIPEINKGSLYKVHINADPTHFLDWDKPVSELPPAVQEKLKSVLGEDFHAGMNGEDAYLELAGKLKTDKKSAPDANGFYEFDKGHEAASKALAEAGIPGIKYLDQGSRPIENLDILKEALAEAKAKGNLESAKSLQETIDSQTKSTRNFVVFDDKLIKIKEKNGNPVVAAVEAATEAETTSMALDPRVFMNMVFKDAKTIGITDTEFKAYSDKIARQEQAVLDRAVKMNKTEIARRLTPEWKRQETAVRDEVISEFKAEGPFAAEKYLRENKIDLAHERAAEVAEGLAPLFGYENGQDLLRGLEGIETERAASGKGPQVQLRDAIKEETARRMEERHGVLAENIAKEARQMALSEHTFDVLADEIRILSKASGLAPPLSRSEMVDWAKQSFEGSNVVEAANWEKHRRAVERGGREAEKALLKGDFAEAFLAKQRQMLAAVVAKESLAFGKVVDSVERKIDRFSTEETIKGMDQAHLEQYRQVLASVGLPQHFAPLVGTGTLRDFVTESQGQLAVAPWLMDGSQPKLQDMSVTEFRDFAKSLQSIEHVGRQATKMENLHGQADLQNVVFDAKKSMERFKFIDQPNHPSILQRIGSFGRKVIGAHLLVERMFDYIDRFDPHGPLTEWVDRPLRDANTKEIVLTEQVTKMLKDLRQHVDASINEKIENNLIPDAHDRSGFLSMTRQDLRVLMLNTGNWSNWKKLSEGFGVNEADLRRMVDQNATAKDVAWVNGIWKIFQHLKPLADEVQLKDTGVPVDHIPAVGWQVKAGTLDGGYYPLAYDRYNSDIQGHIARPLFDNGYFAATTPHGYTQARTEYKGAIDLTGAFLASKIQGMVHDIAFRTAIRNADKLISNQEFRTALEQRWGKEAADLLPGWIRDIANSHNLDDNYARDFVRAASLIRQNVTSTLIGYNPGTFIKHGFTAAVMSADRVGLGALLSSTKEIGLSGAAKNLKELISKTDRVPDEQFMQAFRDLLDQGERGENARQFVLDSSAVMRNRQRQYDESIRGAVDAINQIGPAKTFADFRQRQMQYARLAVAFSDQMSAMPTWLASYKKAYMGGEAHADAVFIADKDMSRAHGSNFVGDKPAVTRIGNSGPGELARWFTGLYNFWNHQFNNLMQLTWDMKAAIDGPGVQGPEPGANAWSISRRIAGIMAIIYIEEQATAAKDEDHRGLGARVAFATIRYLGGGIVGLRDITNGFAHGYEPSTGMIGTLYKAGTETAKDIGKATGAKAGLAKDWITHTATVLGFATGIGGTQLGKTASFTKDLITGQERPRTFNDYRQGFRTGHSKARIHR